MKLNKIEIKQLMLVNKISQKEIADALGMSEAAFSSALKRSGLLEDRVRIIAGLLKVDQARIIASNNDMVNEVSSDYQTDVKILLNRLIESKDETINYMSKIIREKDEIIEELSVKLKEPGKQKGKKTGSG